MGEDAAAQVGAQLADNEGRERAAVLAQVVQKAFQVAAYGLVKDRRLGVSAAVPGTLGAGRGVGGGPGGVNEAHRAMRGKPGAGPRRGADQGRPGRRRLGDRPAEVDRAGAEGRWV